MLAGCRAVQRHAIFTVTKNKLLGTPAAMCTVQSRLFMTASYTHHLRRAGARFMGCQLQRCAAMRPVVISVWNKKTGAGFTN
jgi:hypothetical protein